MQHQIIPLQSPFSNSDTETHTHTCNCGVKLHCIHASLTINKLEVSYFIYAVLWAHTPIYYLWDCLCHKP